MLLGSPQFLTWSRNLAKLGLPLGHRTFCPRIQQAAELAVALRRSAAMLDQQSLQVG
jgi:hypothetical protein